MASEEDVVNKIFLASDMSICNWAKYCSRWRNISINMKILLKEKKTP